MDTLDTRRRKRIVEHIISGFNSGEEAMNFAKAVDEMITRRIGQQNGQFFLAAPNTTLAITDKWVGPTILKSNYLDLADQHVAIFVTEGMRRTIRENGYTMEKEVVREKPQPQRIDVSFIKQSKMFNMG